MKTKPRNLSWVNKGSKLEDYPIWKNFNDKVPLHTLDDTLSWIAQVQRRLPRIKDPDSNQNIHSGNNSSLSYQETKNSHKWITNTPIPDT